MLLRTLLPAGFVLLAGCTNLSAVESASTELVEAGRSWDDVAREVEASCLRLDRVSQAAQDCTESAGATRGLLAANSVLIAYFAALRDSAASGSFDLSTPLAGAVEAAAAVPGAPADQIQAVGSLAGLLADLATKGLRERTIKRLVNDGGDPARRVIALLAGSVPVNLRARLEQERRQQASLYLDLIGPRATALIGADPARFCATPPRLRDAGPNGGQPLLLTVDFCERQTALDARLAAVEEYRRSLELADQTIAALQAGKMRLSAKETVRELIALRTRLDASLDGIRSAFNGRTIA